MNTIKTILATGFVLVAISCFSQKTSRTVISYTGGQYAPIGVSIGKITTKGGFLFNARWSSNVFESSSIYTMTDANGIDDDFWVWSYTGNTQYRRGSATLCYVSNMTGSVEGTSAHLVIGLGYGYAGYFYEYEQTGTSGSSYGTEWIKYEDVTKESVEAELGLLVDFQGFNLGIGYSTVAFEDGMLTFSAGFSF